LDPDGRKGARAPLVPRFAPGDLRFIGRDTERAGTGELLAIEDDRTASRKSSFYKRRALGLFLSALILFLALIAYVGSDIGSGLTGAVDYAIIEALLMPGFFALAFAIVYVRMGHRVDHMHFYENGVVMFGSKRGTPGFFAWTFWKHYRWIQHRSLGKVLVVGDRPSRVSLLMEFDDMFHVTILPSMEGFEDVLRAVRRDLREWGG
jgi:hypothetical protein